MNTNPLGHRVYNTGRVQIGSNYQGRKFVVVDRGPPVARRGILAALKRLLLARIL